jgi:cobalt-zinc-cadmium efflux system membrane fusion protein
VKHFARGLFPALLLLIPLTACKSEVAVEGSSKGAGSNPDQDTRKPRVTLDVATQQRAGLVVEEVSRQGIRETISATGKLVRNEDQTWHVGAIADGRIMAVYANVGDAVQLGQVLARMHSHDVHDSRAAYQKAVAEVARLESIEAQARRIRDRAKRLFDLKAASLEQVENAETELRSAQANVVSARSEVQKERAHLVEFLEVPIEDDPSPNGQADFIPIKAPASGIMLERKVTPGSAVSAGDEVFTISNLSSLWLLASINEADLSELRVGQTVRLLVRAYPGREFRGKILQLGEELDPTTRSLKVRVLVPNEAGRLKPEMFASAEIERTTSRDALFVAQAASQEIGGHRVVFVQTSVDTFEPRPIQVNREIDGRMEIVAGLSPGDRVVTKGSFLLKSQLLKSSLAE